MESLFLSTSRDDKGHTIRPKRNHFRYWTEIEIELRMSMKLFRFKYNHGSSVKIEFQTMIAMIEEDRNLQLERNEEERQHKQSLIDRNRCSRTKTKLSFCSGILQSDIQRNVDRLRKHVGKVGISNRSRSDFRSSSS